ncbi:MAG: FimV/HubP family polar landmark protein [Rhodanobacter sp.]|jgi:pilus assembly protein FimV
MNRSLKLSVLMALALGSSHVLALDLGQVQVKSTLGQPLLAEIPLHPADAAELKNLTVQLASGDEFTRAGIVGGRPSIPLHFSVVNSASGAKVIRITSTVAVDDPYLDLLIEVNGHAGKSVREFAILLDPPGLNSAPPAAVAAAAPTSTVTRAKAAATPAPTRSAPATKPATPMPKAAARLAAVANNGEYGPVSSGQTLSGIARSTAPSGVDVQQMMLALKQANPDAFYRDNINALKSGAVLRVPSAAEAQAMTLAAAIAEVSRQNSDWRAGTPGKPSVVADAATRANASSAPTGKAGVVEDRLALVPAKASGAGSQGNNAGGKGDKSVASLRQDLLRAQEATASLQQQSNDLKSRLKDLSDINGKNERLLSLKDNEIAELQSKLAEARKTAGLPAAAPVVKAMEPAVASQSEVAVAKAASVAPVASGSAALATNVLASAGTASRPAVASTAAAIAPAAVKAATPTPKPVAKPAIQPAPMPVVEAPWYMQTWAWAAGGAALLLLIVLGLRGRRGKSSAKASGAKAASSLADRFNATPLQGSDDLAEEDVDQDELLDQLAEHPDDIDLHLELVTLYYSRRDVERFEAAAEAMHAHITDTEQDEWQDVLHMGEDLVPAHPLFDHHPEAAMPENAEPHGAFDIDDYGHDEHDTPAAASSMPPLPPSGPKKVSEYSFNFDLTQPVAGDSTPGHHSTAAEDATVVAPRRDSGHAAPALDDDLSWQDTAGGKHASAEGQSFDITDFSDDPVDTKLDLARAYVDMGDAEGARAMLGEVIKEGTQTQQDVAKHLLETLR